jgi:signal transduction histidine kinase
MPSRQIFFTFLALTVLFISACGSPASGRKQPGAVGGVLDLRDWDFKKDGPVKLDGEWSFYWKKFLKPENYYHDDIHGSAGFIKVPGVWNGYVVNGTKISGEGYASYRLKVLVNPRTGLMGFKFPHFSTAFSFYVNGRKVTSAGNIGKTPATSIPEYAPHVVEYTPQKQSLELLLLISNFDYKKGGPWESFQFGNFKDLNKMREKRIVFDLFLIGSLIIMGLYHFGLYTLRQKDKSTLTFGLFCVLIGCSLLTKQEIVLYHIFPEISWPLLLMLEFIPMYIGLPVFGMFTYSLFPREFLKKAVAALALIGFILSLFVVLTPVRIHSHLVITFEVVTSITCIYAIYALALALIRKREGAFVFLCGFFILFISIINDILFANNIINTGYFVHLGLFLFVFFQAYLLSSRFSKAFTTVARLSRELEIKSEDLAEKNRELLQLDQVKDEFLSNISHELKTPITSISGFSKIIKKKFKILLAGCNLDDKKQTRAAAQIEGNIDIIFSETARLTGVVNKLVDFTDIGSGRALWEKNEVNLADIMDEVFKTYLPLYKTKGIQLELETENIVPVITADKKRLVQVLDNLLSNALKFTDRGGITCSLKYEKKRIVVSISDTGIGIDPVDYGKIFNKFEQVGESLTEKPSGVGLGLPLSKMIVEHYGGKIWVDSVSGRGSTFRFTLPVDSTDPVD